ncbi:MAG TPA: quinohemoprotein amine dehydrogenase maturation protein, partial [Candidatus Methylomirabilis sp.]|nr:quinohemoprotein amine dehydrogenase maturation protein [Candidatus Methylomirabilis sp.]
EVGQKKACTSCWARRLCAGGCHYDVHLHRGRMEHPVVGLCDYYRGMIGVGLEVYARLAAEVPQILARAVGEAGANCTQGV